MLINFVTLFANALPAAHFVLPDLITPTTYVILKAFTYIFLCISVVATPVLMIAIFKPEALLEESRNLLRHMELVNG